MAAASAPGKLILFGEHAVVFGEPALSTAIDLRTEVFARPHGVWLADGMGLDEPRYRYVKEAAARAWSGGPLWFEIRSMIPVASGLGSSAAVSVAVVRALNDHFGGRLTMAEVSDLAFRVELLHHGTPSGIDNTVIAFGRPVYFMRGRPIEMLIVPRPLQSGHAPMGLLKENSRGSSSARA